MERVSYSPLLSIIKSTKPTKWLMAGMFLFTILTTFLSLYVPLETKKVLDGFSEVGQFNWTMLSLLMGILLLSALSNGVLTYLMGKFGNEQKLNTRRLLLKRLLYLPVDFFDKGHSSEPASRLVKDTEVIEHLVSQESVSFVSGIISLVGSFIILWFLDWRLTAVLFSSVIVSFLIVLPFSMRLSGLSKKLQDQEASLLSHVTELLANIKLVRSQSAEHFELKRNDQKLTDLYDTSMKEQLLLAMLGPIVNLVVMGSIIVVLGFGAMRVAQGDISIGTFIAFIMFLFNIIMPLMQLSMFVAAFNKAAGAALRIAEIIDTPAESFSGLSKSLINRNITFEHVSFGYDGKPTLFTDLSFTLESGKTTALVATSGGGKSTIFSLLQGFYTADGGKIQFAEDNIGELDKHELHRQIGYVAQDSPMVTGTIRDNLEYGLADSPSKEVLDKVLIDADLTEFIQELPDGLETQIGERGITISGGQRQRLALARALLKNPAILLLDEVTASLDAHSEQRITQALEKAQKGRTTVIAAHRLSTIINADQIILLDKGQVIAKGSHEVLLQSAPQYKSLIEKQLKGNSLLKMADKDKGLAI